MAGRDSGPALGGFLRAKLKILRERFDETQADFSQRFEEINSEIEFLEKEIGADKGERVNAFPGAVPKEMALTSSERVVSPWVTESLPAETAIQEVESQALESMEEPEFELVPPPQLTPSVEAPEKDAQPLPAEVLPQAPVDLPAFTPALENAESPLPEPPCEPPVAAGLEAKNTTALVAQEKLLAQEAPAKAAPQCEAIKPPEPAVVWPVIRPRSKIDWEALIGGSWLNIVGIIILVVGMALLTEQSFRAFGPVGRITTGVAAALGLLLGGLFLERHEEKYRILSRTLMGGGWAVLYFMAYAAHNIEAARVISSPIAGLIVMMAVAAAMILHSLAFRSQLVTALAYGLGFFAVGLTPVTMDSLVACAILAASQLVILRLFEWQTLALVAVVGGYLNHWRWISRLVAAAQDSGATTLFPSRGSYWLSLAIIGFYWLLMVIASLSAAPRSNRDRLVQLTVAVANTIGMLGISALQIVTVESQDLYLLVGVATPAYATAAYASRRAGRFDLFRFNGLVAGILYASTLPLALKPLSIGPEWLSIYWLFGGLLAMAIGVMLQEALIRAEAYLLSAGAIAAALEALTQPTLHAGSQSVAWWIAPLTAIGLLGLSEGLQRAAENDRVPPREGAGAGPVWGYVAIAIFAVWSQHGFAPEQASLALLVGGTLLFELGADLRRLHLRLQSYLLLLACILQVATVNLAEGPIFSLWKTAAPTAPVLYYVYWRTRASIRQTASLDWLGGQVASWAATAILASILWREAAPTLVPLLWLPYALALLEIGARTEREGLRAQAYLLCGAAFCALLAYGLGDAVPATWLPRSAIIIPAAGILYGVSWRVSRPTDIWPSEIERALSGVLSGSASVLLAGLAWRETDHAIVAIIWLLLAFALTEIGFATSRIALRVQAYGLSLVALVTLFIFDLDKTAPVLAPRWVIVGGAAVIFYYFYIRMTATRAKQWLSDAEWLASDLPSFASAGLLFSFAWREIPPSLVALAWLTYAISLFEIGIRMNRGALRVQAYLLGSAAFVHLFGIGLREVELTPLASISLILTLGAAIYYYLYWRLVTQDQCDDAEVVLADLISCAGSALIAVVAWREAGHANVGLPWLVFAVALFETGLAKARGAFRLQAYLLAGTALIALLTFDAFDLSVVDQAPAPTLLHRALIIGPSAAIYYYLFWRSGSEKLNRTATETEIHVADLLSFAASGLVAASIWANADPQLIGPFWLLLALPIFEVGVGKARYSLQLQACLLIVCAFFALLTVNLYGLYPVATEIRANWAMVLVAAAAYYYLSWRIRSGAQVFQSLFGKNGADAISFAGTALLAVLIWKTGSSASVALGWAFMAFVLYEFGSAHSWKSLERQGHLMAALAFGRLILANFVAVGDLMGVSYRILTIAPVIALLYYLWGETRPRESRIPDGVANLSDGSGRLSRLYSYGAAFLLFALARFELGRDDWIMGLSPILLALLIAGHAFDARDFRYQSYIIATLAFARTWSTNAFLQGAYYGVSERIVTILPLLLAYVAAAAVSLRHPAKPAEPGERSLIVRRLDLIDENADQMFALLSAILCALLIYLEIPPGWVASAWSVEALVLILLGFKLLKSSYRYYGLALLLFSILKFAVIDLKGLEPMYYIMFGVILLIASFIYSRYRNVLKKYIGRS